MDVDGINADFDIELTKRVSNLVDIPVIAYRAVVIQKTLKKYLQMENQAAITVSLLGFKSVRGKGVFEEK